MQTSLLSDTREDIEKAGAILRRGGLVAFPTETVYGLGANAFDAEAVGRVYEAKGRPSDNPMIVHIAENEEILRLTPGITSDMRKLMDAFWPGPMTMIVPRLPAVPDRTTGGLNTVGVRLPSDPVARAMIKAAGVPIAAPSANISGRPSPTTAEHVRHDMFGRIDGIIMGGACRLGIESSVIDMSSDTPTILRPGAITREMFEDVLGRPVALDPTLNAAPEPGSGFHPRAPGMKYRHYAPLADMTVYEGPDPAEVRAAMRRDAEALRTEGKRVVILDFDGSPAGEREAAHDLFARLRRADEEGADVILAAALPERGLGFSVMNRMLKSAGHKIKQVQDRGKEPEMIIAMAADHGGYELKDRIREHLIERGIKVVDLGTDSSEPVDYPEYGRACGEAVASGRADLGVVCCGSGIGISIAANKVKGVRCALCTSVELATLARQHNDANMIAFGGRTTTAEEANKMVDAWLDNEWLGRTLERHARRVAQLNEM